ncbi:MAG: prolipoprotein diacylglyceryl transferase family protein [Candidatus Gallimonas sp.]
MHPTQLYEAACLLAIFAFLTTYGKKSAFPFYCMLYGTVRFCIECLRGDSRGSIPFVALSPAQLISLALIVLGGAAYAVHTIGET